LALVEEQLCVMCEKPLSEGTKPVVVHQLESQKTGASLGLAPSPICSLECLKAFEGTLRAVTFRAFTVDSGTTDTICACGCGPGTLTVDYTDMTLTNLASGHVYRLDPISQTYTT
jgi:hypothetical protein